MATLVFDVNETLSDMSPLGAELERYGAPAELAGAWFASVLRDGFALSMHGQAPGFLDLARELLTSLLDTTSGLTDDVDTVVEALLETFRSLALHRDVPDAVRRLHADGHTVTAFTNGTVDNARALLARGAIEQSFAHVLSVERLGVWKPHRESYRYAAEQIGVPPSALTMVAVHPWDTDGAHRAGFRTVFVNRSGTPWPSSFSRPDHEVRSMSELPELL